MMRLDVQTCTMRDVIEHYIAHGCIDPDPNVITPRNHVALHLDWAAESLRKTVRRTMWIARDKLYRARADEFEALAKAIRDGKVPPMSPEAAEEAFRFAAVLMEIPLEAINAIRDREKARRRTY